MTYVTSWNSTFFVQDSVEYLVSDGNSGEDATEFFDVMRSSGDVILVKSLLETDRTEFRVRFTVAAILCDITKVQAYLIF